MAKVYSAGYGYQFNSNVGSVYYFKCEKRAGCQGNCNYNARTSEFNFKNTHNHAPDPVKVHVEKAKRKLAEHALANPNVRSNQIVSEVTSTLSQGNLFGTRMGYQFTDILVYIRDVQDLASQATCGLIISDSRNRHSKTYITYYFT